MVDKRELQALSTVKTFNDLARRAAVSASDYLSIVWKAGEVARQAKANMPHGEWMPFVQQHYDVNHKTVTRWMQFNSDIPEAKLGTVPNLTAGLKMLDPPKTTENKSQTEGYFDIIRGEDDGTEAQGTEPQETSSRRRGSAKAKPVVDFGKCPNCAKTKWAQDDEGWFCDHCKQPYGEPAGDVDEDRIKTQRQKTVKTIEALMRAFDDLQLLASNNTKHAGAIAKCKALLPFAKEWK